MLAADVDADSLPAPLPDQARAVDWAALPDSLDTDSLDTDSRDTDSRDSHSRGRATAARRRDGFVYAFEITRGSGEQQRAVLGEPVPEVLRPLVGALVERAEPQLPDG